MNKEDLKSSIKAYALELMKETSTSGNAGGYLTKKAFRKLKKQDIKSPTGFESSPNPNMYTKTMKFKIVNPKDRLNSKDLWEVVLPINQEEVKKILIKAGKYTNYLFDKPIKDWDEYDISNWNNIAKDNDDNLKEGRYTQFKKQTSKRPPREQLHMAIKEIQMKLDEVNKLIDYTSKMKNELREGDEELEYLKRTKNSLFKIQEKLQTMNNKLKYIIE